MISPGRAFLLGPSRLAAGSTDRDCVLGAVKSCQGRSSSRASPLAQTFLGVWFDGGLSSAFEAKQKKEGEISSRLLTRPGRGGGLVTVPALSRVTTKAVSAFQASPCPCCLGGFKWFLAFGALGDRGRFGESLSAAWLDLDCFLPALLFPLL